MHMIQPYVLVSVTLQSQMPELPITDPERREADEALLRGFWAAEARSGHPVSEDEKRAHRFLMQNSGCVAVQGHVLTRAARERLEAEKQVTATKPPPPSNRK
jgi:hypothetical protein